MVSRCRRPSPEDTTRCLGRRRPHRDAVLKQPEGLARLVRPGKGESHGHSVSAPPGADDLRGLLGGGAF